MFRLFVLFCYRYFRWYFRRARNHYNLRVGWSVWVIFLGSIWYKADNCILCGFYIFVHISSKPHNRLVICHAFFSCNDFWILSWKQLRNKKRRKMDTKSVQHSSHRDVDKTINLATTKFRRSNWF